MKGILEDSTIMKVGVGCHKDAENLKEDFGIKVLGTYDLRHLAKKANVTREKLQHLSEDVLGKTMDKDWKISASDWEDIHLSQRQIDYAADDSRTGLQLFKKMYSKVTGVSRPSKFEILNFCRINKDESFPNGARA